MLDMLDMLDDAVRWMHDPLLDGAEITIIGCTQPNGLKYSGCILCVDVSSSSHSVRCMQWSPSQLLCCGKSVLCIIEAL
jgi:hypothetical protein